MDVINVQNFQKFELPLNPTNRICKNFAKHSISYHAYMYHNLIMKSGFDQAVFFNYSLEVKIKEQCF